MHRVVFGLIVLMALSSLGWGTTYASSEAFRYQGLTQDVVGANNHSNPESCAFLFTGADFATPDELRTPDNQGYDCPSGMSWRQCAEWKMRQQGY